MNERIWELLEELADKLDELEEEFRRLTGMNLKKPSVTPI